MSHIHIATEDTFFVDAPVIKGKCLICSKITRLEMGWVGVRCSACGSVIDPFEAIVPDIVKKRRETLKLSRREMANKTGLSHNTIKRYELVECSKKYYELTQKIFKEKWNANTQNQNRLSSTPKPEKKF